MPVEIHSFTTEVSLPDRESTLPPQQMEMIVQEVFRRLARKTREDQQSEQAASFGGPPTLPGHR